MLVITDDARFIAEAHINLKGRQCSFKFEARLMPTDELAAEQARQRAAMDEGKAVAPVQAEFIGKFLTGWPENEVCDKDGKPLAFGQETVAALLNTPGVPMAMVKAFYAGYEEATEGNFEPLPAG